jgi:hypothetical protein
MNKEKEEHKKWLKDIDMNSDERLEILDRFRFAKDEIREIAKIIPSIITFLTLMESKEEFDIVNQSMDRLEQIIYLWWRKG